MLEIYIIDCTHKFREIKKRGKWLEAKKIGEGQLLTLLKNFQGINAF